MNEKRRRTEGLMRGRRVLGERRKTKRKKKRFSINKEESEAKEKERNVYREKEIGRWREKEGWISNGTASGREEFKVKENRKRKRN